MKPTLRTNTGPLDESKWNELLNKHIPDRLREIAWCAQLSELAANGGNPKLLSIVLDETVTYETSRFEWLFHPAYDTGVLMCRVMLEFLGIGFKAGRLRENGEPQGFRTDDVCLLDFDLPFITVGDIEARGPTARDSILKTLRAANKGIGHLTRTRGSELDLSDLATACQEVLSLVGIYLYDRLGAPRPDFAGELRPRPMKPA